MRRINVTRQTSRGRLAFDPGKGWATRMDVAYESIISIPIQSPQGSVKFTSKCKLHTRTRYVDGEDTKTPFVKAAKPRSMTGEDRDL